MPQFSVIIPLYNKEKFVRKTIESVLNQTFSDFEIIVIDDGSTDNSAEIIVGLKDNRINYYLKKNEGVSTARNYGIAKANSQYITFIDADDYWYPNFLSEMHQNIQKFPDIKVFSAAIEFETSKRVIPSRYSIRKTGDYEIVNYFRASLKQSVIWTSCAVFHSDVFKQVGDFDVQIKSGQDTDLWIRVGIIYPIHFSWTILARYVYDPNSLSKKLDFDTQKLNFEKFNIEEKENLDLKKFLDLNRFSLAIKAKEQKKHELFQKYYQEINLKYLSYKKRLILLLPRVFIKLLINLKQFLAEIGLGSSVFK